MPRKRREQGTRAPHAVSAERCARLYRLLELLRPGPQTRATLARRLHIDVRGFYRDLELLRSAGIAVSLQGRRYALNEPLRQAVNRLPFPDPLLTIGEASALAKGRTEAHRKLKRQLSSILGQKAR
jgi:predicted DNA-binding transcriptional regulator YafY